MKQSWDSVWSLHKPLSAVRHSADARPCWMLVWLMVTAWSQGTRLTCTTLVGRDRDRGRHLVLQAVQQSGCSGAALTLACVVDSSHCRRLTLTPNSVQAPTRAPCLRLRSTHVCSACALSRLAQLLFSELRGMCTLDGVVDAQHLLCLKAGSPPCPSHQGHPHDSRYRLNMINTCLENTFDCDNFMRHASLRWPGVRHASLDSRRHGQPRFTRFCCEQVVMLEGELRTAQEDRASASDAAQQSAAEKESLARKVTALKGGLRAVQDKRDLLDRE